MHTICEDPKQVAPLDNPEIAQRLETAMIKMMQEDDAPLEQYQRVGLEIPVAQNS